MYPTAADRVFLIPAEDACDAGTPARAGAIEAARASTHGTVRNFTAVSNVAANYTGCFYHAILGGSWRKMRMTATRPSIVVRPWFPALPMPTVIPITTASTATVSLTVTAAGAMASSDRLRLYPAGLLPAPTCAAAALHVPASSRRIELTIASVNAGAKQATFTGSPRRSGRFLACYLGYPHTDERDVGHVTVYGVAASSTVPTVSRTESVTGRQVLDVDQTYAVVVTGAGLVRYDAYRLVAGTMCVAGAAEVAMVRVAEPSSHAAALDRDSTTAQLNVSVTSAAAAATLCYRSNVSGSLWQPVTTFVLDAVPQVLGTPTQAVFAAGSVMAWQLTATRQLSGSSDDVRVCPESTTCDAIASASDCDTASFDAVTTRWTFADRTPSSTGTANATFRVCVRLAAASTAPFVEAATVNVTQLFAGEQSATTTVPPRRVDAPGVATESVTTHIAASAPTPSVARFIAVDGDCAPTTQIAPALACAASVQFTAPATVTVSGNSSCVGQVCLRFADGTTIRGPSRTFVVSAPSSVTPTTVMANESTVVRALGCDRCDFTDASGTALQFCNATHGWVDHPVSASSVSLRVFRTGMSNGARLCYRGHSSAAWAQLATPLIGQPRLAGGRVVASFTQGFVARTAPANDSTVNVTVEGFGITPNVSAAALAPCDPASAPSGLAFRFAALDTPLGANSLVVATFATTAPIDFVGSVPLCYLGFPLADLNRPSANLTLVVDPTVTSATPRLNGAAITAFAAADPARGATTASRTVLLTVAPVASGTLAVSGATLVPATTPQCTAASSAAACACTTVTPVAGQATSFLCAVPATCSFVPTGLRLCYRSLGNVWHSGALIATAATLSELHVVDTSSSPTINANTTSTVVYSACPMTATARGAFAGNVTLSLSPGSTCTNAADAIRIGHANASANTVRYSVALSSAAPRALGTYASCAQVGGQTLRGTPVVVLPGIAQTSSGALTLRCAAAAGSGTTVRYYMTVLGSDGSPRGTIPLGEATDTGVGALPASPQFGFTITAVRENPDGSVDSIDGPSTPATTQPQSERIAQCQSARSPGESDASSPTSTRLATRMILALNLEHQHCNALAKDGLVRSTDSQAILTEITTLAAESPADVTAPGLTLKTIGTLQQTAVAAPSSGTPLTSTQTLANIETLIESTPPDRFMNGSANGTSIAPSGAAAPNVSDPGAVAVEVAAGQLSMLEPFLTPLQTAAAASARGVDPDDPAVPPTPAERAAATQRSQRASLKLLNRVDELGQAVCRSVPHDTERILAGDGLTLTLVVRHRIGDTSLLRISSRSAIQVPAVSASGCVTGVEISGNILPQRVVAPSSRRQATTTAPPELLPNFTLPLVAVFTDEASATVQLAHGKEDPRYLQLQLFGFHGDMTAAPLRSASGEWRRDANPTNVAYLDASPAAGRNFAEVRATTTEGGNGAFIVSGTVEDHPPPSEQRLTSSRHLIYGFAILEGFLLLLQIVGAALGSRRDGSVDATFLARADGDAVAVSEAQPSIRTLHVVGAIFTRRPLEIATTAARVHAWAARSATVVIALCLLLTEEIMSQVAKLFGAMSAGEVPSSDLTAGALLGVLFAAAFLLSGAVAPLGAPARVGFLRHRDDKPTLIACLIASVAVCLAYPLSGESVVATTITAVAATVAIGVPFGIFWRRRWSVHSRMRSVRSNAAALAAYRGNTLPPTAGATGADPLPDAVNDDPEGGIDKLLVFGAAWTVLWQVFAFAVTVASVIVAVLADDTEIVSCVLSRNAPFDSTALLPPMAFPAAAFVVVALVDYAILEPVKCAVLLFVASARSSEGDVHATIVPSSDPKLRSKALAYEETDDGDAQSDAVDIAEDDEASGAAVDVYEVSTDGDGSESAATSARSNPIRRALPHEEPYGGRRRRRRISFGEAPLEEMDDDPMAAPYGYPDSSLFDDSTAAASAAGGVAPTHWSSLHTAQTDPEVWTDDDDMATSACGAAYDSSSNFDDSMDFESLGADDGADDVANEADLDFSDFEEVPPEHWGPQ